MPVYMMQGFGATDLPIKDSKLTDDERKNVDELTEEAKKQGGIYWKERITSTHHFVVLRNINDEVKVIVSRFGVEIWCE